MLTPVFNKKNQKRFSTQKEYSKGATYLDFCLVYLDDCL